MKHIILTLILSLSASAQVFTHNGQSFRKMELGKKTYIFNTYNELNLVNEGNVQFPSTREVNCKRIDRVLESIKEQIQECKDDFQSYSCKRAQSTIDRLNNNMSSLYGDSLQRWQLNQNQESKISKEEIAKTLGINSSQIIDKTFDTLALNSEMIDVTILMGNESRINLLADIINLDNTIESDELGVGLKTYNRFLACDLLDNSVRLKTKFKNQVDHVEVVPNKVKNLGYKAYKALQKHKVDHSKELVIQAAYIGYEIGKSLDNAKELSISEVFEKTVENHGRYLEIKRFQNENSFYEEVFPVQFFEQGFVQTFYIEVK
mgnify:CR=1 FL=1|tara:strand:- start:22475 stop:23431 length:957 start_codon:yes stop_codon:yes gene_type:complete